MNIHKRFNHEKAISPILATLLLIVIAVAATVITYAWITTYMGSTTQQASFIPYKANVNFENNKVTIDIGNSGTAAGEVVKIYMGKSPSEMQSCEIVSAEKVVEPNSVTSFTIEVPSSLLPLVSKQTYYFKVVPSSGATLSFTEQAP